MPTPPKTAKVIALEGKSHRTKAELNLRKQGEESLLTAEKIKERIETKNDKVAHKEFLRVEKLLEKIEKNDALYEPVINRYCMIQSECSELIERRDTLNSIISELKAEIHELQEKEKADCLNELSKNIVKIAAQMNACDRILAQKRKMLFDIEKENIMTIASALRSIPKKAESKQSALKKALEK